MYACVSPALWGIHNTTSNIKVRSSTLFPIIKTHTSSRTLMTKNLHLQFYYSSWYNGSFLYGCLIQTDSSQLSHVIAVEEVSRNGKLELAVKVCTGIKIQPANHILWPDPTQHDRCSQIWNMKVTSWGSALTFVANQKCSACLLVKHLKSLTSFVSFIRSLQAWNPSY